MKADSSEEKSAGNSTYRETRTPNCVSAALQKYDSPYHAILDSAMDGFWLIDLEGRIHNVNESYCKMSGYTADELLTMSIPDLEADEIAVDTIAHIQKVVTFGKDRFITCHRRKNGTVFDVEVSVQFEPVTRHLFAFLRDITELKLAQSTQMETANIYKNLYESIYDSLFTAEINDDGSAGRFLFVNDVACKQLGYTREELLTKTPADINSITSLETIGARMKRALNEKHVTVESEHQTKDGRIIPVELSYNIATVRNKKVIHAIARDISTRKQAEEALRASEERYRLINNASFDQIYSYDRENRFTSANRQLCANLQRPASEIIGKSYWELGFPEAQCRKWDELHRQVYEAGSKVEMISAQMPDGTTHFFEVNLSTVTDDAGTVIGIAGVNRDVTKQKLVEEALRNSEELLNTTGRMAHVGGWAIDLLGNTLAWTEETFRIHELTPGSQPNVADAINFYHPDDRERVTAAVEQAITHGVPFDFEARLITHLGNQIWVRASGQAMAQNGTTTIIQGCIQNITERKKAEEEHLKFEQQLQQHQKLESLGILAGGIAHDFNNLMGGLFGYIDMASEQTNIADVTAYLSKAMSTIDRARALTQQLLTFAKGGTPFQKTDHLFPFIEQTAKFALSGSHISCNFDVPEALWAANFDKNQIGQVIDNLIINAQQAMPLGGTIKLTATNSTFAEKEHPLLEKGHYVRIAIKDSGVGIPAALIQKIFDPFFTTKTKGHGLGLATSYSIIKRHNGCIDVESEMGVGSTFVVYLPAATDFLPSTTTVLVKEHKGSGTFLVMDDEGVIREAIRDMLRSLGYTVVCKDDGEEAVEFYMAETEAQREIAGIIFDLTIPGGMGGMSAVEEIRKLDKEIPVFVASGYAGDPVMKSPAEYGFTASICKPFRKTELLELLNTHLRC